jgi:hypothetical protein
MRPDAVGSVYQVYQVRILVRDRRSLVATCETNGVNPMDYQINALIRVQPHPASRTPR